MTKMSLKVKYPDDRSYYDDDYYHNEVKRENLLLRQQSEAEFREDEELNHQLQEACRNPLGRPKNKLSRRTLLAETETAVVQEEPKPHTRPVARQVSQAAAEMQSHAPQLPAPQGA